ncbi:hypothetical protein TNCV_174641 [Trichonephila clavipes]|nr:hypothetical protein TNCV_174641 [Trichonephila clavipes]
MAQHRPRKSAPVEYTTDEEDMIAYDVEDELEYGILTIQTPAICDNCYSLTHSSRFCSSDVRCINCGGSHSGQCTNSSNCTNCKGDHPANSPNCPTFIKEKNILESKCTKHLTLGEARQKLKETNSGNYAIAVTTAAPGPNIQ